MENGKLTDADGNIVQLYGMSTHGIAWFPQYINYDSFRTLRDDWNTNCIRLAMYTAEYGGYCAGGDKEQLKQLVRDGVSYATELGMYTLHFYAGTHKDDLRNRLETCAQNNLPVFVSEFGMCDASGNGANDFDSTTKWLDLLNKYQISFCCWNLANKDESSSVFKAASTTLSDWTDEDFNESGRWIREYFRSML